MNSDSQCPDPHELAQLLELPEQDSSHDALVDHLGTCADCQAKLENLAVNKTDWKDWETVIKSDRVWPEQNRIDPSREEELPTIPGFQVLSILGEGGMGVVYKARQHNLNRLVALKRMRSSWSREKDYAKRFEEEAKALGQLQHPNLVQIYDVFEHRDNPVLVLEYVGGGTLADSLRRAAPSSHVAAQLIFDAALAIGFAHQKGILHRDLKPANLLLQRPSDSLDDRSSSRDDSTIAEYKSDTRRNKVQKNQNSATQVKVTDFGLARQMDDPSNWTKTGEVMGTPSYMSPEQARGDKDWSKPAVDIYALGAVLYEALTGRPPFRADSAPATINQLLTQEPIRPSSISREVPRDLETICLKCLNKRPADRYETAFDLADDLQRFLDGKPILAKRQPFWVHAGKWVRRQPVTASLVTSTFVAATFLLIMWFRFTVDLQQVNQDLEDQTRKTNRENLLARKAAVEANQRLEEAARILADQADLIREMPELGSPAMRPLRNKLVKQTLDSYQDLVKELKDAGKVPMESEAYARMSQLYRDLGDTKQTVNLLSRAIELRRAGQHTFEYDMRVDSSLAVYLVDYASVLINREDFDLAEASLTEAIGILTNRKLVPSMPESFRLYRLAVAEQTFAKMLLNNLDRHDDFVFYLARSAQSITAAIEAPDAPDMEPMHYLFALTIYRNLGHYWHRRSKHESAQKSLSKAVEYGKILIDHEPKNILYRGYLATAYCYLASAQRATRDNDESLNNFRSALEIRNQLASEVPRDPKHFVEQANIEFAIGGLLAVAKKNEEAFANYISAAEKTAELVRKYPDNSSHLKNLIRMLYPCLPIADDSHKRWQELLQFMKDRIEPWKKKRPEVVRGATTLLNRLERIAKDAKK